MVKIMPKPAVAPCFNSAAAASGMEDGDPRLHDAFYEVRGRMMQHERDGMNPSDAAARAGQEIAEEHRAANARAKLNAKRNVAIGSVKFNRVVARAEEMTGPNRIYNALLPEITATYGVTEAGGEGASTEAVSRAIRAETLGLVHGDLVDGKLLSVARGGKIDRDTELEMYEHSKQAAGEDSNIGRTGNQQAMQIAAIYHKHLLASRDELNKLGADIGNISGYITKSSWDPEKLLAGPKGATKAEFIRDVLSRADERTFDNTDDREAFAKNVYDNLASGNHDVDSNGVTAGIPTGRDFANPQFTGPGNLAKKVSSSRVLHWKTPEDWQYMMQRYGNGQGAMMKVASTLERQANQRALLSHWGTNPRAMYDAIVKRLEVRFKGDDNAAVRAFGDKRKDLDYLFGELDGSNSTPARNWIAKTGNATRAIISMSMLGNVAASHVTLPATGASVLHYHAGMNLLQAWRAQVAGVGAALRNSEDFRHFADITGAGMEGARGMALHGWADRGNMAGTMSKITNNFYKMTGLPLILRTMQQANSFAMSRHLAEVGHLAMEDLNPETRQSLQRFGITPDEWDAWRGAPDRLQFQGQDLLTPDAVDRSPADMSDDDRRDLRNRASALINSIGHEAVITPTMRSQKVFTGFSPNTAIGQALRFMGQFKQFTLASGMQGFGREIAGRKKIGGQLGGLMHLVIGTTIMGYMASQLKELMNGNKPRAPTLADIPNAVAQGGGFGIMGDFMFGGSNRFGQSFAETLAGPGAGMIGSALSMWNNIRDAAATGNEAMLKKVPAELTQFGLEYAPFIHLFYLRGALNYLLLDSLQESLNPGYLERQQAREQKQQGTTYLAPSIPHLKPFGQ